MCRRLIVLLLLCVATFGAQAALPELADLVERRAASVVNVSASRIPREKSSSLFSADERAPVPAPEYRFMPTPKSHRLPNSEPEEEEGEDTEGLGSGLIISADGYILTNAHVVAGADEIQVRLQDKREYAARLIGSDSRTDIALLKIDARNLPKAVLGDPTKLRVGDWVVAIGSPFGFDNSVTAGIVSAKNRSLPEDNLVPFIQTDVAVNPGNSGGPLFNLRGEVVGINSQIYSQTGGFMGLSFTIPIDLAMNVQAQLRERGRVRRGRIGVLIQGVTRNVSDSFLLDSPRGALISELEPQGPAELAGLKVGDIVLRFDGKPVLSSNDLPRIVSATQPGQRAVIQYWRSGRAGEVTVTVAELPDEQVPSRPRPPATLSTGVNRLGLLTQELSADQRKDMGLSKGVSIRKVTGLAVRAELRVGDVIVGMMTGGRFADVAGVAQFNKVVLGLPAGTAVSLLVRRGDTQSFVAMKLPSAQ